MLEGVASETREMQLYSREPRAKFSTRIAKAILGEVTPQL
jgi:hypothetical protein